MQCKKCGQMIEDGVAFCSKCGAAVNGESNADTGDRYLPAFILGLIGSIFGLLGGICTTMCSVRNSTIAFLLICGGAVVGMVGACKCLKDTKRGSILQLVGAVLIIIQSYTGGAEVMTIFGFVILLFGGLVGLFHSLAKRK